jgi:hypothetical protein
MNVFGQERMAKYRVHVFVELVRSDQSGVRFQEAPL